MLDALSITEEAPSVRTPADPRALRRRLTEVRGAVTRVVFAEHEGPETEDERLFALEALEELLLEAAGRADFARGPLDDEVAQVCRDLELSPALARRWRDLPDPPDGALAELDERSAWRGSG